MKKKKQFVTTTAACDNDNVVDHHASKLETRNHNMQQKKNSKQHQTTFVSFIPLITIVLISFRFIFFGRLDFCIVTVFYTYVNFLCASNNRVIE